MNIATRLSAIPIPVPDLVGLLTAALVAFCSTRPWARVWGVGFASGDVPETTYVNGIEGGVADGWFILGIGIAAAVLMLVRIIVRTIQPRSSAALLGVAILLLAIAGVLGMLHWFDSGSTARAGSWRIPGDQCALYFQCRYYPAWGLIVVTLAGFVGAIALAFQMWRDHLR
jgi:hypothetical protein